MFSSILFIKEIIFRLIETMYCKTKTSLSFSADENRAYVQIF